jgi:flavin reductase (DIM6/NTAB) family NADH-FMN oxidoreductase RutF/rubredoxin
MDRKVLYMINYGLYVVSSKKGGKFNGQIANTVFQVISEPPSIAVCINKQNLTHEFIQEDNVFAVSILSEKTPMEFIWHFGFKSGRDLDKFKGLNYKIGVTGAPIILDNCTGYLEAKVVGKMDAGTHTIFLGEVIDAKVLKDEKPMTYAYYYEVKHGKSPKKAPTYMEEMTEEREIGRKGMNKWRSKICRYVYDPEKGDLDSGIERGTPFEELPKDWICPICGAGKDEFEMYK